MSTSISPLGQTTNNGSQIITLPATLTAAGAATVTLSTAQSGCIVSIPNGHAALLTINLPTPASAPGFTCKFVVNTTLAAFAVVISSVGANTMNVSRIANDAPAVGGVGLSTGFALSTAKGATIDLYCDGINYYATGRTVTAAGSITTA